eukprot:5327605-Prymnesium_polylepis.1
METPSRRLPPSHAALERVQPRLAACAAHLTACAAAPHACAAHLTACARRAPARRSCGCRCASATWTAHRSRRLA